MNYFRVFIFTSLICLFAGAVYSTVCLIEIIQSTDGVYDKSLIPILGFSLAVAGPFMFLPFIRLFKWAMRKRRDSSKIPITTGLHQSR